MSQLHIIEVHRNTNAHALRVNVIHAPHVQLYTKHASHYQTHVTTPQIFTFSLTCVGILTACSKLGLYPYISAMVYTTTQYNTLTMIL